MLKDGKKSTSEGVVYGALSLIGDRTGRDPVAVMEEAVRNVTPALEVKSRRRRRDLPGADRVRRGQDDPRDPVDRAVRAPAAGEADERAAGERAARRAGLAGGAFKRKDDLYRMAQANKAFRALPLEAPVRAGRTGTMV